ncbi:MAG: dihydroneopterin aldolase, partial [Lachnospiraceae bacterium]|nr:dihydroneopterin aldolase [Lachnospiraceae bacterium]
MDNIIIRGLEVYAYHGVYENEKAKGQRFVINAKLDTDTLTS